MSNSLNRDVTLTIKANDQSRDTFTNIERNVAKLSNSSEKAALSFKDAQKTSEGFTQALADMGSIATTFDQKIRDSAALAEALRNQSASAKASLESLKEQSDALAETLASRRQMRKEEKDPDITKHLIAEIAELREKQKALTADIRATNREWQSSEKALSRTIASQRALETSEERLLKLRTATAELLRDSSIKASNLKFAETLAAETAEVEKLKASLRPLQAELDEALSAQARYNDLLAKGALTVNDYVSANTKLRESLKRDGANAERNSAADLLSAGISPEAKAAYAAQIRKQESSYRVAQSSAAEAAALENLNKTLHPVVDELGKASAQQDIYTKALRNNKLSIDDYVEANVRLYKSLRGDGQNPERNQAAQLLVENAEQSHATNFARRQIQTRIADEQELVQMLEQEKVELAALAEQEKIQAAAAKEAEALAAQEAVEVEKLLASLHPLSAELAKASDQQAGFNQRFRDGILTTDEYLQKQIELHNALRGDGTDPERNRAARTFDRGVLPQLSGDYQSQLKYQQQEKEAAEAAKLAAEKQAAAAKALEEAERQAAVEAAELAAQQRKLAQAIDPTSVALEDALKQQALYNDMLKSGELRVHEYIAANVKLKESLAGNGSDKERASAADLLMGSMDSQAKRIYDEQLRQETATRAAAKAAAEQAAVLAKTEAALHPVISEFGKAAAEQEVLTSAFRKGKLSIDDYVKANVALYQSLRGNGTDHERTQASDLLLGSVDQSHSTGFAQSRVKTTIEAEEAFKQLVEQEKLEEQAAKETEQAIAKEDAAIEKLLATLHPIAAELGRASEQQEQLNKWLASGSIAADDYLKKMLELRSALRGDGSNEDRGRAARTFDRGVAASEQGSYNASVKSHESALTSSAPASQDKTTTTNTRELEAAQRAAEQAAADLAARQEKLLASLHPIAAELGEASAKQSDYNKWVKEGVLTADEYVNTMVKMHNALRGDGSDPERQRAANTFSQGVGSSYKADYESALQFEQAQKQLAESSARAAETLEQEQSQLQRWKAAIDPVGEATKRAAVQQKELNTMFRQGKLSADEYRKALDLVNRDVKNAAQTNANSPTLSLFGLRPWETQNLLFQLNDIITQLSSGTSLSQTLAQQGGQIFQLFQNRLMPTLTSIAKNPWSAIVVAGLVAVATEAKHVVARMEELREIQTQLTSSADGDLYNAEALHRATIAMRYYGASAKDALASVMALQKAGISQDMIPIFGRTAQNMATVTGQKLSETTKALTTAFGGTYKSIAALDDQYDFLTAKQREEIMVAMQNGDSNEALSEAMGALTKKMQEASAEAEHGLWPALKRLASVMVEVSDKSGITGFMTGWITQLTEAGKRISLISDTLHGIDNSQHTLAQINEIKHQIDLAKQAKDSLETDSTYGFHAAGNAAVRLMSLPFGEKGRQFADNTAKAPLEAQQQKIDALTTALNQLSDKYTEQLKKETSGVIHDPNSQAAQKQEASLKNIQDADLDGGQPKKPRPGETRQEFIDRQVGNAKVALVGDDTHPANLDYNRLKTEEQQKAAIASRTAAATKEAEAAWNKAIQDGIKQFVANVGDAEGTGPNRMGSSASGHGQFMPPTWLNYYDKTFGNTGQTSSQKLEERDNKSVATAVIDTAAKDYAAHLEKAGQQVNAATLYLVHFLGKGGALSVLRNLDKPVDSKEVGLSARAIHDNPTYLYDKDKGRARTGQELLGVLQSRIGNNDHTQSSAASELRQQMEEAQKRQRNLNQEVADQVTKEQALTAELRDQLNLTDRGKLERQKSKAILEADLALVQKVNDLNANRAKGTNPVVLTDKQRSDVRQATSDSFDAQHMAEYARADRQQYDKPVAALEKQRGEIGALIQAYEKLNEPQAVGALDASLTEINKKLAEASAKALDFYESIKKSGEWAKQGLTEDELDAIISKLRITKTAGSEVGKEFLETGKQINEELSGGISSSMGNFLNSLAQGKGLISSLRSSFGQFFADFFMKIGEAIIKQQLFNSLAARSGSTGASGSGGIGGMLAGKVMGLFGSAFGGGSSSISSSFGSSASIGSSISSYGMGDASSLTGMRAFHTGGILGPGSGMSVLTSASNFINAPKFHDGGVLGLKSDEMPIVGKVGEEMLTRDDPRHVLNGGKNAPQNDSQKSSVIKNVIVQDPKQLATAMSGTHGQQVVLSHIANNSQTVRMVLGL